MMIPMFFSSLSSQLTILLFTWGGNLQIEINNKMNADEAEKCYEIAQTAIKERDFDKAERMLNKSIKLNDTDKAKVLLSRLDYLRS